MWHHIRHSAGKTEITKKFRCFWSMKSEALWRAEEPGLAGPEKSNGLTNKPGLISLLVCTKKSVSLHSTTEISLKQAKKELQAGCLNYFLSPEK